MARIKFPAPAPCGKTPLTAAELSKSYGSLEVFTDVDLAIDKGSRVVILGLNGAGKTTMLRILGRRRPARHRRRWCPATASSSATTPRSTRPSTPAAPCWRTCRRAAPQLTDTEARSVLGSFLFSGDDAHKPAAVLSGGEKTRLALATLVVSSANVLLLDEPTNNLDPASREEVLAAIRTYEGAIILVTHDEGAVRALEPDRVLLLPDGDEDLWNEDYARPGVAGLSTAHCRWSGTMRCEGVPASRGESARMSGMRHGPVVAPHAHRPQRRETRLDRGRSGACCPSPARTAA